MTSAEPTRKAPYSNDIRWRIVWQRFAMDLSYWKIAQNLSIGAGSVYNVFKTFQNSGEVSNSSERERADLLVLTASEEMFVVGLVLESPCLYLRELCQRVEDKSGFSVSVSTICRLLGRHGFSRKKVQKVALERNFEYRADFMADVLANYTREKLVWLDEMGSDRRDAIRQYGYAIRGETPVCHRLQVRGQRISTIAAISSAGVVATEFKLGSVNSDDFYDFVRGNLFPNMHPYDGSAPRSVALMDNCSIHHVDVVTDLFEAAGINIIFLPPYSPDYNPIELAFSSVKYYLKEHDVVMQAMQDTIPLIKCAFDHISPEMCNSWISCCGYV